MNILVIHEVSYLKKPVYEYQDFPERLGMLGHEVTVIDFDEQIKSGLENKIVSKTGLSKIKLISLPNTGIPVFKYLIAKFLFSFHFKTLIKEIKPDVILLYSVFINGVSAVRVARALGIPIIYRGIDAYHLLRKNPLESQLLKLGEKYIYRNANFISVTNEKMRDYVLDISGGRAAQTEVLNHGVDTDHFKKISRDESLASNLKLKKDDFVCLFLGTTYEFSRLDQLVKAIPTIIKSIPNFKLLIVGAGELDNRISSAASQMGTLERVIQVGMISYEDLPKYLSLANIAINPFEINSITRDIIPIKILQYLASELPVISTPLPDLTLKIPASSNAIFYSETDSIADLIDYLINEYLKCDLPSSGKLGRKYMEENYSINKAISLLENILGGKWNT